MPSFTISFDGAEMARPYLKQNTKSISFEGMYATTFSSEQLSNISSNARLPRAHCSEVARDSWSSLAFSSSFPSKRGFESSAARHALVKIYSLGTFPAPLPPESSFECSSYNETFSSFLDHVSDCCLEDTLVEWIC